MTRYAAPCGCAKNNVNDTSRTLVPGGVIQKTAVRSSTSGRKKRITALQTIPDFCRDFLPKMDRLRTVQAG